MHHAHPPRVRWHVETYDPTAAEWSSGLPFTRCQDATDKRTRLDRNHPTWRDGTPVRRRLVLETTTYEDFDADVSHLALFPKSGFVITGVGGQDFAALPDQTPDGRPAIRYAVGSSETGHADVVVPLDQLEEVIAGMRDMARQTGEQPAPLPIPAGTRTTVFHWAADLVAAYTGNSVDATALMLRRVADGRPRPTDPQLDGPALTPRRQLTELEHDRAWHAIEGIDWEAGPDPDTVLNAVLAALAIDPPEVDEMAASLRRDGFGDDEIAEMLADTTIAGEGAGA
ncbi:hypothetical protein ACIA6C_27945 [Streptomyces sp. NPDC051578]|uniref:hypothetical protein n=1 Tax=Streptomyces sp. NPDC051578 TaxID=3365662 RepID=UPI003791388B